VTRQLLISSAALADLQAIWDFGAQNWSDVQAETYLTGLRRIFNLLQDQPHIARLRSEFTPPVRLYRYQSHVIVFFADDAKVDISRVLYGRSNWAEFLSV
jgi:toxin ParE1/3/4